MALILSAASGNFNAGATWVGGVVPTVGDEARASTGHTITITANATCTEISNAGTGTYILNSGVTLTANVTPKGSSSIHLLTFSAISPAVGGVVGNVAGSTVANSAFGVNNTATGTLNITGNVTGGQGTSSGAVNNASSGVVNITGNVSGGLNSGGSFGAQNSSTGTITITGNVIGGAATGSIGANNSSTGTLTIIGSVTAASVTGVNNTSTGTLTITGDMKASTSANAVSSANASSVVRASGSFFSASNGMVAVYAPKFILLTTPIASKTQYALNGTSTYVDMFTSDNTGLGPATNDVRSGVTYSGMTGTLAVPLPSQVAVGVATDATTGTAVLDPAAVASAVWGAATRTITGGLVDTATTLTNAPTVPTASAIASQVRTELATELANIDASVSSRLAGSAYSAAPTAAANATAVWSAATKTITGGTVDTLTNSPSVPSAASIASATRSELATELGRLDAAVSTRLATSGYTAPSTAPTAADNAAAVRAELATELARVDVATSTRLASSAYTAPSNSDVAAIKAKTDLLNTDRLAQCSTVATTGSQLAAALS